MRILCSGGSGLIGSHLIPKLIERGHEVTELRRYTATRGLAPTTTHKVVWFDLHNSQTVEDLEAPDILIHLGAMASNAIANANPVDCFDTNATGTLRLLHSFRNAPSTVVIAASSSEVYAKPTEVSALNPYAASKIAVEEIVRCSGHPWIITRPFNTYGRAPLNAPVAVADKWVRAALLGEPIYLGDMETVRDYLWRDDHVNAYLKIVEAVERGDNGIYGRAYDFGTGRGVTLDHLLQVIQNSALFHHLVDGGGFRIVSGGYHRTNDVPVLVGNPHAAEMKLGWVPTVSLEEGIELTMKEWHGKLGLG